VVTTGPKYVAAQEFGRDLDRVCGELARLTQRFAHPGTAYDAEWHRPAGCVTPGTVEP
jgi:hypothetical protein